MQTQADKPDADRQQGRQSDGRSNCVIVIQLYKVIFVTYVPEYLADPPASDESLELMFCCS